MRTRIVPCVNGQNLRKPIDDMVDKTRSRLITDDLRPYRSIACEFAGGHKWRQHNIKEYSRGDAHCSTAESFFSLLKRGTHGAFHHVSNQHLQRYCDEFALH